MEAMSRLPASSHRILMLLCRDAADADTIAYSSPRVAAERAATVLCAARLDVVGRRCRVKVGDMDLPGVA